MPRVAVLNVVGLTERHLGPDLPRITAFAKSGSLLRIDPVLPAVTCTAQSTYLTGLSPGGHGAVANGWYDRRLAEVQRQARRAKVFGRLALERKPEQTLALDLMKRTAAAKNRTKRALTSHQINPKDHRPASSRTG